MPTEQDVLALLAQRRHDWINRFQLLYGDLALGETKRLKHRLDAIVADLRREQRLVRLGDPVFAYRLLERAFRAEGTPVFYAVLEGGKLPPRFGDDERSYVWAWLSRLESVLAGEAGGSRTPPPTRSAEDVAEGDGPPLALVVAVDAYGHIGYFLYGHAEAKAVLGAVRAALEYRTRELGWSVRSAEIEDVAAVYREASGGFALNDLYREFGDVALKAEASERTARNISAAGLWLVGR